MAEVVDRTTGWRIAVAYRKAENGVRRSVYPRVGCGLTLEVG